MNEQLTKCKIALAVRLVGMMRFDSKKLDLADCWWNSILSKFVTNVLEIDPRLILWRMVEHELKRRDNT